MKCYVCENNCFIPEDGVGKCGLYSNRNEKIVEIYPNQYLIINPITIETMPMLHFMPRGKFLQVSTVGCNFDCPGCISTVLVKEAGARPAWLQLKEPEMIINEAIEKHGRLLRMLPEKPEREGFSQDVPPMPFLQKLLCHRPCPVLILLMLE